MKLGGTTSRLSVCGTGSSAPAGMSWSTVSILICLPKQGAVGYGGNHICAHTRSEVFCVIGFGFVVVWNAGRIGKRGRGEVFRMHRVLWALISPEIARTGGEFANQ